MAWTYAAAMTTNVAPSGSPRPSGFVLSATATATVTLSQGGTVAIAATAGTPVGGLMIDKIVATGTITGLWDEAPI